MKLLASKSCIQTPWKISRGFISDSITLLHHRSAESSRQYFSPFFFKKRGGQRVTSLQPWLTLEFAQEMGDWAAFQEDFWKVLSTLGINQENDANPEDAEAKPENDAKDQKAPAGDLTSMREKEEEWVQRNVWDSRLPHPVPSYPVVDTSLDSPVLQYKRECRFAERNKH
jgi:hypothetical protein